MLINLETLSSSQTYHTMTQTIIPRPIAWVLTDNGDKSYNLAPFSYFNAICSNPPLVMLSIGKKPDGDLKDTRTNIIERKSLVIHIPNVDQAVLVTESSRSQTHGDSEIERMNLELVQEENWALPRLANTTVAMECELYELHELGPNQQAVFYCEVKNIYLNDSVVEEQNGRTKIDARKINPLGRLGANQYVSFGEVITIPQPK